MYRCYVVRRPAAAKRDYSVVCCNTEKTETRLPKIQGIETSFLLILSYFKTLENQEIFETIQNTNVNFKIATRIP